MSATNTTKKSTVSLTFGDVAENHKGMQQVGTLADVGFDLSDLQRMQKWFEATGKAECRLVALHEFLPSDIHENKTLGLDAYILIIKNGVNAIFGRDDAANDMLMEQSGLETDKKAIMYGHVVNKHARHNLCFGETHQDPDYEAGKGTIYAFDEVPMLKRVRESLREIIGDEKGTQLQAEGNYYYDHTKCGIGFHGDAERKKVFAVRLGEPIPLCYSWFKAGNKVGDIIRFDELGHGDIYVMSEKTTGFDWKRSSIYTLRHAAGAAKYLKIPDKPIGEAGKAGKKRKMA